MKKIISVVLAVFLMCTMIGCGNSKKQSELRTYINYDMEEMGDIEKQLLRSYNSVTGDNYTSDYVTYAELEGNTIILARNLNSTALNIASTISNKDILKVHKLYLEYTAGMLSAIGTMIEALKNQDYSQLSSANEKLNDANNLALEFKMELNDLADEYNVDLK